MIKQIAWNTFKKTGNLDTFLEFKQISNIEENIKTEQFKDENFKSEWHNYSRKNGCRF